MNALIAIMAALVLLALVLMVCVLILFHRTRGGVDRKFLSVTSFLAMTSQVAALVWVSCSYAFAGYATIALGQPFPVTDLSSQAIAVLLGNGVIKAVTNIFEHNDGKIFGASDKEVNRNE